MTFVYFLLVLIKPACFVRSVSSKLGLIYPDAGAIYYLFPALYTLLVCLGIGFLFVEFRHSEGTRKNQIKYLFAAMAIGFGGGVTTFPLIFDIPVYPFGVYGPTVLSIIIAYAITKHKLMDISVVIKQATAYAMTAAVVVLTLAGAWLLSQSHSQWTIPLFGGLALFWAFAAIPLKNILITTARRAFVRGWYDPQAAILMISAELGSTIERNDIFSKLAAQLDDVLELEGVQILPAGHYRENRNPGMGPTSAGMTTPTPIDMLPTDQRNALVSQLPPEYHRKSLVLSLFSSGKTVEGILVLGPKASGKAFNTVDLDFLSTLQQVVEIVFEKIKPYEKIKAEFDRAQVETAKLETALAMIVTLNHEINSPLTAIKVAAQSIGKHERDQTDLEKITSIILTATNRISALLKKMEKMDSVKERPYLYDKKMVVWE